ncbi:hypothetical protein [Streptomyces sp. NPDC002172]
MHPDPATNAVYEQTAALLDWGFGKGRSAQPVGTLVDPLSEGGASASPSPSKGKGAAGAAGAGAAGSGASGPSPWRVAEGGAVTFGLLGAGAWALRRRRRRRAAGAAAGPDSGDTTADSARTPAGPAGPAGPTEG